MDVVLGLGTDVDKGVVAFNLGEGDAPVEEVLAGCDETEGVVVPAVAEVVLEELAPKSSVRRPWEDIGRKSKLPIRCGINSDKLTSRGLLSLDSLDSLVSLVSLDSLDSLDSFVSVTSEFFLKEGHNSARKLKNFLRVAM